PSARPLRIGARSSPSPSSSRCLAHRPPDDLPRIPTKARRNSGQPSRFRLERRHLRARSPPQWVDRKVRALSFRELKPPHTKGRVACIPTPQPDSPVLSGRPNVSHLGTLPHPLIVLARA